MLAIEPVSLDPDIQSALEKYQDKVDRIEDYAARVAHAKKKWNSKNDHVFDRIRMILAQMCFGSRRCAYCEDSMADEIEHIAPKDIYPELTFVWTNYLFACGPCNGPKGNQWSVFLEESGTEFAIVRKRGDVPQPPPEGVALFIDPRTEDPLEFMTMDLKSKTFRLIPRGSGKKARRAEYTIDILNLNDRDVLPRARGQAYIDYVLRLENYIRKRDQDVGRDLLDYQIQKLRTRDHRHVWEEMKRQHTKIPELAALFERAPEALAW